MSDKEFVLSIYPSAKLFKSRSGYQIIINNWSICSIPMSSYQNAWLGVRQYIAKEIEEKLSQ
jgi:hypothetical protein